MAGLFVGLIAVGLQWSDNLALGATGAAGEFLGWIRRPLGLPGWRAMFFVGAILGSGIYAVISGRFALTWSYPGFDATFGSALATKGAVLLLAGGLIGFGARWAGGCTSGHGICGVGRLQPGSLLATAPFVGTAIVVAHLVARAGGF